MDNEDNWNEFVKTVKKLSVKNTKADIKIPKRIEVKSASELPSFSSYEQLPQRKIRTIKARTRSVKKTLEALIDLHGLNLESAYRELVDFIKFSHANGFKFLLVITGKAKTSPQSTIRRELPLWLETNAQISWMVRSYSTANKEHGGEGAFYVVLNRD